VRPKLILHSHVLRKPLGPPPPYQSQHQTCNPHPASLHLACSNTHTHNITVQAVIHTQVATYGLLPQSATEGRARHGKIATRPAHQSKAGNPHTQILHRGFNREASMASTAADYQSVTCGSLGTGGAGSMHAEGSHATVSAPVHTIISVACVLGQNAGLPRSTPRSYVKQPHTSLPLCQMGDSIPPSTIVQCSSHFSSAQCKCHSGRFGQSSPTLLQCNLFGQAGWGPWAQPVTQYYCRHLGLRQPKPTTAALAGTQRPERGGCQTGVPCTVAVHRQDQDKIIQTIGAISNHFRSAKKDHRGGLPQPGPLAVTKPGCTPPAGCRRPSDAA